MNSSRAPDTTLKAVAILRRSLHKLVHVFHLRRKNRQLVGADHHSPITRLPGELLAEIFRHGVCLEAASNLNRLPTSSGDDLPIPFSWAVSQVSQIWRAFAIADRHLWTYITVVSANGPITTLYLERSRGLALTLFLVQPISCDILFRAQLLDRCQDLLLSFNDEQHASRCMKALENASAPCMKSLTICVRDRGYFQDSGPNAIPVLRGGAPALKSLSLIGTASHLFLPPTDTLTDICLRAGPRYNALLSEDITRTLGAASSSLTTLSITGVEFAPSSQTENSETWLPALTSLTIAQARNDILFGQRATDHRLMEGRSGVAFWEAFIMPSLNNLSLDFTDSSALDQSIEGLISQRATYPYGGVQTLTLAHVAPNTPPYQLSKVFFEVASLTVGKEAAESVLRFLADNSYSASNDAGLHWPYLKTLIVDSSDEGLIRRVVLNRKEEGSRLECLCLRQKLSALFMEWLAMEVEHLEVGWISEDIA